MKSNLRYSVKRGHVDARGLCDLEATVSAGGRRWRCLVGLKCKPDGFDLSRQAFPKGAAVARGKLTVQAAEANALLDVVRGAVLRLFAPLTEWPPVDEVRRTVAEAAGKTGRKTEAPGGGFAGLAEAFLAARRCGAARRHALTRTLRTLACAEASGLKGLGLDDFAPARYEAYLSRICAELSRAKAGRTADPALVRPWRDVPVTQWPRGMSRNSLTTEMTAVRSVLLWAYRTGRTASDPFAQGTYERPAGVYGTPYYPNKAELDLLAGADLRGAEDEARDLFVFQACVGCRVSDLASLGEDNARDGRLHYVAKKTAGKRPETIEVPLARKALAVLEKWSARGLFLPPMRSDGKRYNRALRKAFRAAGLVRKVEVLDRRTGEAEVRPLWEVATSHMARRAFVGNLVNAGVKDSVIGAMSGHVPGSRAFARYYTVEDGIKSAAVAALD